MSTTNSPTADDENQKQTLSKSLIIYFIITRVIAIIAFMYCNIRKSQRLTYFQWQMRNFTGFWQFIGILLFAEFYIVYKFIQYLQHGTCNIYKINN